MGLRAQHHEVEAFGACNVNELAADITAWAGTWNENPRPFVWTKSAEQILERLAAYCAAIKASA